MSDIEIPSSATLARNLLDGFVAKRAADELANLVSAYEIIDLRTGGDAYIVAATNDYTPAILAAHAAEVLTGLVRDGHLTPIDRSCFEIMVRKAQKADTKKNIPADPGAIAIVRNQASQFRLPGGAAVKAREELLAAASTVKSVASVSKYRAAIAEANMARFDLTETRETVETSS